MQWWRDAVVYQIYVRSFSDSDGDGVGDLAGVRSRLGYLELLGVDALWLTPFYTSPMADHGYDVSDPRDVDPLFGDLDAFDALVAAAHEHGMRVTVDLVPNHTSSEHEWFRAALAAAPGSPERARYYFRPGRGPAGDEPPNNWTSIFGGPAWTRVPDPDGGPGRVVPAPVRARAARPGLDQPRGVGRPGEDPALLARPRGRRVPHRRRRTAWASPRACRTRRREAVLLINADDDPRFDQDGVHDVHRMIRAVIDHYPGRMLIGEIWVRDDERFARYVRPDELHLGLQLPSRRGRRSTRPRSGRPWSTRWPRWRTVAGAGHLDAVQPRRRPAR